MERVTINDISKEIGVSPTTVYKALNDKPKVSDEMRKKILKKAKEMNYKPNKLAQGLARGTKTIGFIIPHYPMNFIRYVENGIKARINELNDYNIKGIVKQPMTSQETVLAAKELIGANVDGIILLSNQVVPGISEVLKETGVKDLPIAAIVSEPMDGTPIVGTVRSNGQILGSMAAQFLSMCVDNSKLFAVLIPEEDAVIHTKCYESFLRESMSRGMHSTMLFKSSLGKDKDNYKIAEEIIEQNKNIGGIYVASNNAVGVCKYLEDADRKDITVIGHDLYPELAQCIEKGSLKATLFQNQYLQAKQAVNFMVRYITGSDKDFGTRFLRPELVMNTNLECYKEFY